MFCLRHRGGSASELVLRLKMEEMSIILRDYKEKNDYLADFLKQYIHRTVSVYMRKNLPAFTTGSLESIGSETIGVRDEKKRNNYHFSFGQVHHLGVHEKGDSSQDKA